MSKSSPERQQQLIGSLTLFFRPDAHRNGRDEEEHDDREPFVQLAEVAKLLLKNSCGQKAAIDVSNTNKHRNT